MKSLKKSRWILIILSILVLLGCAGMTGYLLFSNYQNVRLFRQAQSNFERGDNDSLSTAEAQLQQLIRNDNDHEAAFIMLGEIAGKRKVYPEQVYYSYMAHRLNPLSVENKEKYIRSLWNARYFDRLENFLSQQHDLSEQLHQQLLYSAGRNGNLKKYKVKLSRRDKDNSIGELALLLFEYNHLTAAQKLFALKKIKETPLNKQELLAARAELYLQAEDLGNAEKALKEAYLFNSYAFAPALGRFYANYRSLGEALSVFEKHLSVYHDPAVALRTAEIYCLLKKTEQLAELRSHFQSDSGSSAMLLCYYLDALSAFANGSLDSAKEFLMPLRKNISTPLALYMFLCADIKDKNLTAIIENYSTLSSRYGYAELKKSADDMVSDFLKSSLKDIRGKEERFQPLAARLYERKKEVFTAKLILIAQKKTGLINVAFLKDALKSFPDDQGILKFAIEYTLKNDLAESARLIARYKKKFPAKAKDMLRYEMIYAAQKRDLDLASSLFKKNFSPELLEEYWRFASSTMREDDLRFLSRSKVYAPFCQALLFLKKGEKGAACSLLEKADAQGNLTLLFFAAKTLAENGRNQTALEKYAQFPEKSPYQLVVLLNTAELYAESGDAAKALLLAEKAYKQSPDLPETQLCFADKLHRNGKLARIPDVVKLKSSSPFRKKMMQLWADGMRQRIKESDFNNRKEMTRELCRQLLSIVPDDKTALECLKKLNKMPQ